MTQDQNKFSFQHSSLAVADVDVSVAFYMKIFGFEEIPNLTRKPWIRWLGLDNGLELHLIQSDTDEIKVTRQVHLAWSITNFTEFLQELEKAYPKNADWLGNLVEIEKFGFKIPVDGMEGGRGSSMNTKIFEAFKSTEHPFVKYQQTQPATVTNSGETGVFTVASVGDLSMAGSSKSIAIECQGVVKNGTLIITGSKDLKMSDYNMVPPTAMFGQIKTNDKVVVNFKFHYVLNK